MGGDRRPPGREFFSSFKVPPGRHGLSPAQVRESQRWRLIGSCAEILAARGYVGTTLNEVVATAAVSKKTFYELFGDLPECIRETHEVAARNTLAVAREACAAAADPAEGLPLAVSAVLAVMAAEPELASVLLDPALLDVPGIGEARRRFDRSFTRMLAASRAAPPIGEADPRGRSLHLVRAASGWIWSRVQADERALRREASELASLLGWP